MKESIEKIIDSLGKTNDLINKESAKNDIVANHSVVIRAQHVINQLIGGLKASQGLPISDGGQKGPSRKPLTNMLGKKIGNASSVKENPGLVKPAKDDIEAAKKKTKKNVKELLKALENPELTANDIYKMFSETEWRMIFKKTGDKKYNEGDIREKVVKLYNESKAATGDQGEGEPEDQSGQDDKTENKEEKQ